MRDSGYTAIGAGKVVAHLIEQNWFSKEQVYAEELRSQLAEALPGSVSAMMRAAGFSNEKDFFKAVEAGKIMATDVMPKFADELKKIARTNGALQATTQKTNAQMQRFFNQLTYAKDEIFQNGMDDGLGNIFRDLSIVLSDLKPIFKVIGGLFKGFASVVGGAIRLITTPLAILGDALENLGLNSPMMMSVIGGGGALMLLAGRIKWVASAVFGLNIALMAVLRNMAKLVALPLLVEDMYSMYKGRDSLTGRAINSVGGMFGQQNVVQQALAAGNPMSKIGSGFGSYWNNANPWGLLYNGLFGDSKVTVEVKGDEAAKFIQATVDKSNQARTAVTQTETSQ